MIANDREEFIILFDIYQELLTEKQREYFTAYYFDDLSISEIAENFEVSRNAVFDQIKKVCSILLNYEDKLLINKKNREILNILDKNNIEEIKEEIQRIIKE